MTNPLAQDLGGVVLLPCPFCGGQPKFGETNTGVPGMEDCGYAFVECCIVHAHSEESVEDAIEKWNTRTHSAEIAGVLRDAESWQPIESAPRDGSKVLLYHAGYKSAFYQRDHEPRVWVDVFRQGNWYNTAPSAPPTHWRPLPAPPTQDSAMQQGGGGGGSYNLDMGICHD